MKGCEISEMYLIAISLPNKMRQIVLDLIVLYVPWTHDLEDQLGTILSFS